MYHFINDKYKVNCKLPRILQDSIDEAERADRENHLGEYLIYADNIDIVAKNCCADGAISREVWDTLVRRYAQ